MKRNKNAKARTIPKADLKKGEKRFSLSTTIPTMLDDQLTNGQYESISRKTTSALPFFLPPSPILSFHRSQTWIHHLPPIPLLLCRSPFPLCKVPLSIHKTNMILTKKGTIVTKEKLFRPSSLLASNSSFTYRMRILGGLSNNNRASLAA